MTVMRAKLQVVGVQEHKYEDGAKTSETVSFSAVCRTGGYEGTGGLDEDNTFAMYSPSANLSINIANPALFGQFKAGQKFYVDFTEAPA